MLTASMVTSPSPWAFGVVLFKFVAGATHSRLSLQPIIIHVVSNHQWSNMLWRHSTTTSRSINHHPLLWPVASLSDVPIFDRHVIARRLIMVVGSMWSSLRLVWSARDEFLRELLLDMMYQTWSYWCLMWKIFFSGGGWACQTDQYHGDVVGSQWCGSGNWLACYWHGSALILISFILPSVEGWWGAPNILHVNTTICYS